jgi:nucleotide-binding universal stress UspA family protein
VVEVAAAGIDSAPKRLGSPAMKPPFRTILCPTDLSPTGNHAVEVAYLLAANDAVVHLVHVDAPPKSGNPLYPDEKPSDAPTPAQIAAARKRNRERLEALVPAGARARGVRTEIDLVEGEDVPLAIEAEARNRKASVVVLGSHGRWGLARLVHGESVATRLLHRPHLDVIVVHTDAP